MKMVRLFGCIMTMVLMTSTAQAADWGCQRGVSPAVTASTNPLDRNKALVAALFDIIYGTSLENINHLDALVAEDYIQHNPRAEQGREGLRKFLNHIVQVKELNPSDCRSVNFIAEGDRIVRQEVRTNGMLIDIFRIENGKLKEHWDAFRFAPGAKIIPGF